MPAHPTVVAVAGNLHEMALDLWNLQSESCWTANVMHDPLCNAPSFAGIGFRCARPGL